MRLERGIDVRKVIDVGMMILLLLLMAFPFTGQDIHIFLGIIMIVFFIIHHYLNRRWYLSLFKGKKTKIQILFITINSLLLISIFGVALSGLTLAGYVPIMSYFLARKMHLVCSYWSYLLMGLHVGLHLQVIKMIKNQIIVYGIMLIGIILFTKNQILIYLLNMSDFLYVSNQMNIVIYMFEYLIIFILFVLLMNVIIKEMKKK